MLRAAALLELSRPDLEPAEKAHLIRVGEGRLVFTHPPIRSAAYHVATSVKRLAAHRALAESYEGEANADRRAWQLAAATIGVDETVAVELEKTAEHARTRGGYTAEAAAYERAAQRRARRGDRSWQRRRLVGRRFKV